MVAFLLFWGAFYCQAASATNPTLCIFAPGGPFCYPIADIWKLDFQADTLVVMSTISTDRYLLATIQRIDFSAISTSISSPGGIASLPSILKLFPNEPNPVVSKTRIAFRLPEAGHVNLAIYAVNGRLVRTLIRGGQEAGDHAVVWDGRDDSGREVSTGVYFYRLSAPGTQESRRMILLR